MLHVLIRAGLHYGSWIRTMGEGFFNGPSSWSNFHGPIFLNISFESMGPLTKCNLMWTKNNDHAPKSECVDFFFKYMSKKGNFERKKSSLLILLSSLGLYLSSLLVKCVEDVACKSSHNNFYKKNEQFNLYMFNVIYMWHVSCVVPSQDSLHHINDEKCALWA